MLKSVYKTACLLSPPREYFHNSCLSIRCYIRPILILLFLLRSVCYAASVSTRTSNTPGTLSAECFVMEYCHVLSVKLALWLRMTPSKPLVSGTKVLRIVIVTPGVLMITLKVGTFYFLGNNLRSTLGIRIDVPHLSCLRY
jgi:hypothetical protein